MNKCYTELLRIPTFEERVKYLHTDSKVGGETFGNYRYLNQQFYNSREWKQTVSKIIVRDNGFDLAIKDRLILDSYMVHHIVPLTVAMLLEGSPLLLDEENLITTSKSTHNAVHYNAIILPPHSIERTKGDTTPWLTKF